MYDEKLNVSALGILKWAPVFMMFFGYWIMGNRQIFNNSVAPKDYRSEPTMSMHRGLDFIED